MQEQLEIIIQGVHFFSFSFLCMTCLSFYLLIVYGTFTFVMKPWSVAVGRSVASFYYRKCMLKVSP